jgi:hypothetical protein
MIASEYCILTVVGEKLGIRVFTVILV